MALAVRELRSLIGRVDNDNVLPRRNPVRDLVERRPAIGRGRLSLDYETLATRLEAETGILWAWMRHPERACFTPALMPTCATFRSCCVPSFGELRRPGDAVPLARLGLAGGRRSGAWAAISAGSRSLIRSHDEAGLARLRLPRHRYAVRQPLSAATCRS